MPPTEPRLLAAMTKLGATRTEARHEVASAARELVAAVRELLVDEGAGVYLRGMPNLNVDSNRYYGLIVRTERGSRKDRLPPPENHTDAYGREVLVFTDDAILVMARRNRAGDYNYRPATEADIRAEDIEPIMRTVDEALGRHLANVERGVARYQELHDLASRLRAVLQGAA